MLFSSLPSCLCILFTIIYMHSLRMLAWFWSYSAGISKHALRLLVRNTSVETDLGVRSRIGKHLFLFFPEIPAFLLDCCPFN